MMFMIMMAACGICANAYVVEKATDIFAQRVEDLMGGRHDSHYYARFTKTRISPGDRIEAYTYGETADEDRRLPFAGDEAEIILCGLEDEEYYPAQVQQTVGNDMLDIIWIDSSEKQEIHKSKTREIVFCKLKTKGSSHEKKLVMTKKSWDILKHHNIIVPDFPRYVLKKDIIFEDDQLTKVPLKKGTIVYAQISEKNQTCTVVADRKDILEDLWDSHDDLGWGRFERTNEDIKSNRLAFNRITKACTHEDDKVTLVLSEDAKNFGEIYEAMGEYYPRRRRLLQRLCSETEKRSKQ